MIILIFILILTILLHTTLHYTTTTITTPTTTGNGELWVFGRNLTHYAPLPVTELKQWFGDPAIYVLDCSGAGILMPYFLDHLEGSGSGSNYNHHNHNHYYNNNTYNTNSTEELSLDVSIMVLAACRADEILPLNPAYPADIFTACLTTPIQVAVRWFILQVI